MMQYFLWKTQLLAKNTESSYNRNVEKITQALCFITWALLLSLQIQVTSYKNTVLHHYLRKNEKFIMSALL